MYLKIKSLVTIATVSSIVILSPLGFAADTDPIIIGAAISLTTDQAIAGLEQQAGIQAAVDEINAAGGVPGKGNHRKLKVIYEDNANSPANAVNALERVLSNKPSAVMLSIRGTHVLPQLPLLEREGVPGLTISATNAITKQNNKYIFRFYPNDSVTKPILVKYITEEKNLNQPAIFHSSEEYGKSGRDAFLEALGQLNIKPNTVQAHKPTDKDFTPQLQNIKNSGANVIYMQTQEAASALILKQAKRMELGIPFAMAVTSVGASALDLLQPDEISGDYAEAVIIDPNSSDRPEIQTWAKGIKENYNITPDYAAELDYDLTKMLAKVIEEFGPEPDNVQKGLSSLSYEGLITTYKSDLEGNMNHEASVIEMTNEKTQKEVFRGKVSFTPREE